MVNLVILRDVPLDFTSPFDELSELRTLLTTQQIAELTGLRRETISRARPDSRFQRRTEKALGDLYLVVTRMRSVADDDLGQIAAILRRPQAALHGRSIAELLKEGRVDEVLEQLGAPEQTEPVAPPRSRPGEPPDDAAEAFLAADPELAALLPEIEAKVREHFAPTEGGSSEGSSKTSRESRATAPATSFTCGCSTTCRPRRTSNASSPSWTRSGNF